MEAETWKITQLEKKKFFWANLQNSVKNFHQKFNWTCKQSRAVAHKLSTFKMGKKKCNSTWLNLSKKKIPMLTLTQMRRVTKTNILFWVITYRQSTYTMIQNNQGRHSVLESTCPTSGIWDFLPKICTLYYVFSGRGKKTTCPMALWPRLEWRLWV